MVSFPKVNNIVYDEKYQLVHRFLTVPFWENTYDDLFAEDIVVDFPYAPPGMYQHMIPFEFLAYRKWMAETVRQWQLAAEPTIIPINDGHTFWTISAVSAQVYWAKRETGYENEVVCKIEVRDGKIAYLRIFENPIAYCRAMGAEVPHFEYLNDITDDPPCIRMAEGQVSKFTTEQNVQRAINNFANPIDGHDSDPESIYAFDAVEVTPYAPHDMYEVWSGKILDQQIEWMMRDCPEWTTIDKVPFYQSVDPNVIVVESFGYGRVVWSHTDGHYTQRELQIVHLDDSGKVSYFRVYFDPMRKFASMNKSVPSFPYYNF